MPLVRMLAVGSLALLLGASCDWKSSPSSSYTCGASNCVGCCLNNACQEGRSNDACGNLGQACSDCTPSKTLCDSSSRTCVAAPPSCSAAAAACSPTSACCSGLECSPAGSCRTPCGSYGEACCTDGSAACQTSWICFRGICQSGYGQLGRDCAKNADCESGLCLPLSNGKNVCTGTCAGADDCVPGWTCDALAGVSGDVCQCKPATEACNGKDDDCNGEVDDGFVNSDCSTRMPHSSCKAGQCVCDSSYTACGSRCVDLQTDSSNCGACAAACTSGSAGSVSTCFGGTCHEAIKMGSGCWNFAALDSTNLYWTDDGDVLDACALSGCTPGNNTFLSGLSSAEEVASDGTNVFVASPDGVTQVTLATKKSKLLVGVSGNAWGAMDVAVRGTTLAWSTVAQSYYPNAVGLHRCTLPDCADASALVTKLRVDHLQIDDTNAFWVSYDGTSYNIERCALAGCAGTPAVFYADPSEVMDLALDDTNVYWAFNNGGEGGIRSCPIAGCTTPTPLVDHQAQLVGLALDASSVFFGTEGGIYSCPKAGCAGTPTAVVSPSLADWVFWVRVDDSYLYWCNGSADYDHPGVYKTHR